MVNIVDNSFDYRETNHELAKEVGELRQQLGLARDEIYSNRAELHRKDVEIVELKAEVNDLLIFRRKYNAILDIIQDRGRISSIAPEQTLTISGIPLALPEPPKSSSSLRNENINSININNSKPADVSLGKISEKSEENDTNISSINYNDSLEPPEVTSVPSLVPERVVTTPSIWKCLDATFERNSAEDESQIQQQSKQLEEQQQNYPSIINSGGNGLRISTNFNSDSPIQHIDRRRSSKGNNCDMLHSTPVRVQIQKNNTSESRLSVPNDQENVKMKKQKGHQNHKRSRQPAKRVMIVESEPRYNLRKRTKT